MKILRGRGLAISAILLCILYLGYRIYEHNSGAAALREETLAGAVPTVAIINPKPSPPTETITLPGNIQGWFEPSNGSPLLINANSSLHSSGICRF